MMSRLIVAFFLILVWSRDAAPSLRPATVEDSVRMRSFVRGSVKLSPQGSVVAYAVNEPNLTENRNDQLLYIRSLSDALPAVLALRSLEIRQLSWVTDGSALLVLHEPRGQPARVARYDLATGSWNDVTRPEENAESFAASANGQTIAFTSKRILVPYADQVKDRRGVVIAESDYLLGYETRPDLLDKVTRELVIIDPDGKRTRAFLNSVADRFASAISRITISPDGRHLTFVARAEDVPVPSAWASDPWYQFFLSVGAQPSKLLLAERTATDQLWKVSIAHDSVPYSGDVVWSDDGSRYLVSEPSPVGDGRTVVSEPYRGKKPELNLYEVDPRTRTELLVMSPAPQSVLIFDQKGSRIRARLVTGEIVTMRKTAIRRGVTWAQIDKRAAAESRRVKKPTDSSDGRVMVSIEESPSVPPDLWVIDLETGNKRRLTELNPELKFQRLGAVQRLEWKGSYEIDYWGHLILPIDYKKGGQYPCVIMAKSWDDSFIHGGQVYRGNFAPQALASAGFVVLMLNDHPRSGDAKRVPPSPGNMREALVAMDQFSTARRMLAERGLIDPARTGIMGFSRSSWYVDMALTHPKNGNPDWAAAVSVDGGLYNYSTYFLFGEQIRRGAITQYGGPPYGATLKAWQEFSPAWNADRVRTPVLLQYHTGVLSAMEFYYALKTHGKPVELIYFPEGEHILQRPSERQASMEQVVDWFRFWLQGIERQNIHDDPGRFARWRALTKTSDLATKASDSAGQREVGDVMAR